MPLEHLCGFERGSAALEDISGLAFTTIGTDADAHEDSGGNGGAYVLKSGIIAEDLISPLFENDIALGRHVVFFRHQGSGTLTVWWRSGSTNLGRVFLDFGAGTIAIYTGSGGGTLRDSASVSMSSSTWHALEFEVDIHDSAGSLKAFIDDDGTHATPLVDFTGDTKPGSETTYNRLVYGLPNVAGVWVDDVMVNSVAVEYDGGSGGAPAVGDTVTGGTSSASGVVYAVDGNATAGTLRMRATSGVWANNEAITTTAGSGTLNALVNAPDAGYVSGYSPSSGYPGTIFIKFIRPTGNGTTSGLTGSDGNSTDNYLLVDEQPMSSADYVEADADDEFDTYGMENLPSTAVSIIAVQSVAYASKDGAVINNLQHAMRTGGANYFSESYPLPGSDGVMKHTWVENPNTGVPFTVADINGAEAGAKFKA